MEGGKRSNLAAFAAASVEGPEGPRISPSGDAEPQIFAFMDFSSREGWRQSARMNSHPYISPKPLAGDRSGRFAGG
eukprot:scaffold149_cov315-Pinguiococcus_pyrenoidosus.AAC.59